jgi:hypothetical protein
MVNQISILTHAATNGFNVLLTGKHGIGKTAIVQQAFDELGWNWKYFSASTIDPWVDLVGVPKEKDGVLELIRPASIDFENIQAIFLDEYNRAPKKVRNAVMELIQFKSINGKKFPNLKVVFAAVNPDDDEELSYDVEKLDPAQLDRFHIHLPVKPSPDSYYFKKHHGNIGALAVKWWNDSKQNIRDIVSPRRLEAAVKVFVAGGDVKYVLDHTVNVSEFCEYVSRPDSIELLDKICNASDEQKREFLFDNNNLKHVRKDLMGKTRYLNELAHLLPEQEIMKELRSTKGNKVIGHVIANVDRFEHMIDGILLNSTAYSSRVVDAFKVYRSSNGAVSSPSALNRTVTIKGRDCLVSEMVICFSGRLSISRDQAEEHMKTYGASITHTVTINTTHLVAGKATGTKLARARSQGVEILTEQEFSKVLQELSVAARV